MVRGRTARPGLRGPSGCGGGRARDRRGGAPRRPGPRLDRRHGQDNVDEFSAALAGEEELASFLWGHHDHLKDATAGDIVGSLASVLPDVDQAVLTDELGADLACSFHDGLRNGIDGWLDDDLAFTRPWGFDLAELRIPVALWQGSADLMVPFAHGEWLASRLPGASVHLERGEGHLSVGVGAPDRMLDELLDLAG